MESVSSSSPHMDIVVSDCFRSNATWLKSKLSVKRGMNATARGALTLADLGLKFGIKGSKSWLYKWDDFFMLGYTKWGQLRDGRCREQQTERNMEIYHKKCCREKYGGTRVENASKQDYKTGPEAKEYHWEVSLQTAMNKPLQSIKKKKKKSLNKQLERKLTLPLHF